MNTNSHSHGNGYSPQRELSGEIFKESFTDIFYTNLEQVSFSFLNSKIFCSANSFLVPVSKKNKSTGIKGTGFLHTRYPSPVRGAHFWGEAQRIRGGIIRQKPRAPNDLFRAHGIRIVSWASARARSATQPTPSLHPPRFTDYRTSKSSAQIFKKIKKQLPKPKVSYTCTEASRRLHTVSFAKNTIHMRKTPCNPGVRIKTSPFSHGFLKNSKLPTHWKCEGWVGLRFAHGVGNGEKVTRAGIQKPITLKITVGDYVNSGVKIGDLSVSTILNTRALLRKFRLKNWSLYSKLCSVAPANNMAKRFIAFYLRSFSNSRVYLSFQPARPSHIKIMREDKCNLDTYTVSKANLRGLGRAWVALCARQSPTYYTGAESTPYVHHPHPPQYTKSQTNKTPVLLSESGRIIAISKNTVTLQKVQPVLFYSSANLHVKNKEWVKKGAPILTLNHQTLITGDIVQGIPRIEQLFEAFTSPNGEANRFSTGGANQNAVYSTLHSQVRDCFRKNWFKHRLPIAVRKSLEEIQQILVESIQKVYLSQGVLITDKHIEIIVRQMTGKGQILDSGSTGLLLEEILPIKQIENANITTPGKKCLYVPAVIGLTSAALSSDSFISAASFQETTRVLSRDAVAGKMDFLRGLKEKVVIGDLISAGTGLEIYFVYNLL